MTTTEAFNDALQQSHIAMLRKQLAEERTENARLRLAMAKRENQLVRFYTRKLQLTRWLYRILRAKATA